jgi:uncharacterized membrane protein HdeD (DUF308 family)
MRTKEQARPITDLWWLGALQGILAIFFGAIAIFWPGLTLFILVYLFSAFVLVWGITETVGGVLGISRDIYSWMHVVFGLFGLGIGVYLMRHPAISFGTFIILVGLTLIIRGIMDLVRAVVERATLVNRGLYGLLGLLAIAAGILILTRPAAGGVAFVWALGLYALVFGALTFAISLGIRSELNTRLTGV